jgi:transposase
VDADLPSLPDDIEALKAALIAARAEVAAEKANAAAVGAEPARARAVAANDRSLITLLRLEIEKLRRAIYGPRSERTARVLDQSRRLLWRRLNGSTSSSILSARSMASRPPSGSLRGAQGARP